MSDKAAAARISLAFEMYELGIRMQRSRLRRQKPAAPDAAIDAEFRAWLRTRPGALLGDSPGRRSRRFE